MLDATANVFDEEVQQLIHQHIREATISIESEGMQKVFNIEGRVLPGGSLATEFFNCTYRIKKWVEHTMK